MHFEQLSPFRAEARAASRTFRRCMPRSASSELLSSLCNCRTWLWSGGNFLFINQSTNPPGSYQTREKGRALKESGHPHARESSQCGGEKNCQNYQGTLAWVPQPESRQQKDWGLLLKIPLQSLRSYPEFTWYVKMGAQKNMDGFVFGVLTEYLVSPKLLGGPMA